MIKLVAFDCDGVLFDSRQANIAFYNDILARFEQPRMDPEAEDFVHSHTVWDSLDYIFQGYPIWTRSSHYCRNFDYSPFIPMMVEEPHLREFLDFLRPACLPPWPPTAPPPPTRCSAIIGWRTGFDLVVSAQDVSRPKPHPEAFARILDTSVSTPREAIYIGDSEVDEAFAANAGVPLVAYRNPRLQGGLSSGFFCRRPGFDPATQRAQPTEKGASHEKISVSDLWLCL